MEKSLKDSMGKRIFIDMNGNEIDAKTGKIIKKGAMMDFAKEVLNLPDAAVQSAGVMRLFQDGEGGIIHHVMNTLAGTLGEIVEGKPSSLFAKGPNAQTES